jgi:mono/diheme cytochrome c family protein
VEGSALTANNQPNGILLDLIRYVANIVAVVGGLALLGGLLFLLVTRANPQPVSPETEARIAQAQATSVPPTPVATPAAQEPASAAGTAASSAASPEIIAKGQELFIAQGCVACHAIEGMSQGSVGPDLTNMGVVAAERAKDAGVADAATYIRQSIVDPNAYIVPECPMGPCVVGMMPQTFGQTLSEEEVEALVQFLLAQKGG